MFGRSATAGNYAYATTRVKARKSFLFPRETYMKLLQMSVPEINRFIGESKYKQEIDELATRYDGIDLVEYALNLNLAREMNDILGFCQGELRVIMWAYLMRWDVWNIKSLLRGKFYNATEDDIRETFVPAGSISMQDFNDLLKKGSVPDVVEGLSKTIFYKPLINALDDFNKTKTLAPLENTLDLVYYENLLSIDLPGTKADELFVSFIRREIDFTNLRTLFRLKRAGLEHEKIMPMLIPGGARLNMDDLRKLAQAPGFDDFINLLKEYSYWAETAEAVDRYRQTGSLNAVEIALYKDQIAFAEKISHLYPLSICPILGYAIRKNVEVNNIRTISRGKEMELSDEVIKSQLVI
ncbi:MAG: V-type ATP synthase subunit C [Methanocella sp. PtaU1.Bin125]|nr:MAG: V-type ATP synthase subunit C [Methanocella sp. PtaU1.Bin125]